MKVIGRRKKGKRTSQNKEEPQREDFLLYTTYQEALPPLLRRISHEPDQDRRAFTEKDFFPPKTRSPLTESPEPTP